MQAVQQNKQCNQNNLGFTLIICVFRELDFHMVQSEVRDVNDSLNTTSYTHDIYLQICVCVSTDIAVVTSAVIQYVLSFNSCSFNLSTCVCAIVVVHFMCSADNALLASIFASTSCAHQIHVHPSHASETCSMC